MAKAWYTSRQDVKNAMSTKETARNNKQIDRAINSASDLIEGMTHRKFYPEIRTQYLNGSQFWVSNTGILYLEGYDVLEVTGLSVNNQIVDTSNYFLSTDPIDAIDFPSNFASVSEYDDIVITGVFGYTDKDIMETVLDGALDITSNTLSVANSAMLSVGHTIRIDDERMRITNQKQKDTGLAILGNLEAKASANMVAVSDADAFSVEEVILVDAEKMLIVDIAGNNLIVQRAWDGSVLASHTNSAIYAPRTYVVSRAVLGTIASAHIDGSSVYRLTPPGLIQSLCIAETMNILEQQKSGYARTIGSGESERESSGRGLSDIRKAVMVNYRRYRLGAA